jgi:hypothetical protein
MVTWQSRAACIGRHDLDWDADVPPDDCCVMCSSCPVARECLAYGLAADVRYDVGVLAGTGPAEREAIRQGTVWQRPLL